MNGVRWFSLSVVVHLIPPHHQCYYHPFPPHHHLLLPYPIHHIPPNPKIHSLHLLFPPLIPILFLLYPPAKIDNNTNTTPPIIQTLQKHPLLVSKNGKVQSTQRQVLAMVMLINILIVMPFSMQHMRRKDTWESSV